MDRSAAQRIDGARPRWGGRGWVAARRGAVTECYEEGGGERIITGERRQASGVFFQKQ
jgi:hypothetical protein